MNRPRLTKQRLNFARSQPIYCAVIIDLYQQGVITKEKAEQILGFDIVDDFYPESMYSLIYKQKGTDADNTPASTGGASSSGGSGSGASPSPAPSTEEEDE